MFFGQNLMEITLKLTLTPLKFTKVINFHSQYDFTYKFSLNGDKFLKFAKKSFGKKFIIKSRAQSDALFFGSERERNFATERERKISERVQVCVLNKVEFKVFPFKKKRQSRKSTYIRFLVWIANCSRALSSQLKYLSCTTCRLTRRGRARQKIGSNHV
jgi:hypothetical protein